VRTLALETSGSAGSVAALAGDGVLFARDLDPELRSARTLAPAIRELLAEAGWRPRDVQLVAVTVGPGSFTGLRIGVTTAKVLAYAVGAEVLGVNTLEVIAHQAPADTQVLWAVLDAHRDQVFAARFVRSADGSLACDRPTAVIGTTAWLTSLVPGEVVTGPMLEKLADRLPTGVIPAPPCSLRPTASVVGRLALRLHSGGHRGDLWKLVPLYYRPSAAEEKLRPASR
jgi:tRNA threonylcarbamoyladenosine biosynthesis protein TsaB